MTAPTSSTRIRQAQPRRLHLVMRDGTLVEGRVFIGEDQALVPYLNGRRGGWMNVAGAHRPKLGETPGFVVMQSEHIIFATAPDNDMMMAVLPPSVGVEERNVEIVLLGGKTVRGFVNSTQKQRLVDFISAQTGRFMSLHRASIAPEGRLLGDIALNTGAIEILRDLREGATIEEITSPSEPLA